MHDEPNNKLCNKSRKTFHNFLSFVSWHEYKKHLIIIYRYVILVFNTWYK